MPFSNGGRLIACGFEQRGDVELVLFEVISVSFFAKSPWCFASEEPIARRGAERRCRMSVSEPDALSG